MTVKTNRSSKASRLEAYASTFSSIGLSTWTVTRMSSDSPNKSNTIIMASMLLLVEDDRLLRHHLSLFDDLFFFQRSTME